MFNKYIWNPTRNLEIYPLHLMSKEDINKGGEGGYFGL